MTQIPWTVIFSPSDKGRPEAEVCIGPIDHEKMLNEAKDRAKSREGKWSVVGIIKGNFAGGFYGDHS